MYGPGFSFYTEKRVGDLRLGSEGVGVGGGGAGCRGCNNSDSGIISN